METTDPEYKWVEFSDHEPKRKGVIVMYMPGEYREKYFLMNLGNDHHCGWYDKHKKAAKAWLRVPKYRKQDIVVDYDQGDIAPDFEEVV